MSEYSKFISKLVDAKMNDKRVLREQFLGVNVRYAEAARIDAKKKLLDDIIRIDNEVKMLGLILNKFRIYDITDIEETNCEGGYEGCDHDDWESMSDECKQARAEAHEEARQDTFG